MSTRNRRYQAGYADRASIEMHDGISLQTSRDVIASVNHTLDTYKTDRVSLVLRNAELNVDLCVVQLFALRDSSSIQLSTSQLGESLFSVESNGVGLLFRIRNLCVDGGVVCNLFSESDIRENESGDYTALNHVNVINPFATMDYKVDAVLPLCGVVIAIAPHVSHSVQQHYANAKWVCADTMNVTHHDRDAKKQQYQSRMESIQEGVMPDMAKLDIQNQSIDVMDEAVDTRICNIPCDFTCATTVVVRFVES